MTRLGPADAIVQVRRLLGGGLRPGEARTDGALTLMPIAGALEAPAYVTAAQAFAAGTLTIGELQGGSVPQLVVKNAGDLPALLLDGEHLEGAMQDRVLNVTVLAPARHDTVIPVSCVERGRWGYAGRVDFVPGDDVAYAELRALKAGQVAVAARAGAGRRVDQGAVWADVERKRAQMRAGRSRTGKLRDAYEDRRGALEQMLGAFPRPAADQTGVLVFVGGRPLALDAFDRPGTLASLWPRLVRGYVADAFGHEPATIDPDAASAWLRTACGADAETTAHEGVGLGIDVIVTSSTTVATALTWDGGVVHLSVFPSAPAGAHERWFHAGKEERA